MLPNMSGVLSSWEQAVTIKNVARTTTDFVAVDVVTPREQLTVVQVAKKSALNSTTINWSLQYLLVHSKADILMGEYIEFNGADYKVILRGNWDDYGYLEVVAEETGLTLIA